ncbi:MAG: transcriptional regulator [Methylococcales bacterium]|nr:transcriptional regulator [Methylococcales bacterium]
MNKISSRQHGILEHFLVLKQGLSIEKLADALAISRTAVQQHFYALESEGYIKKNAETKTAGRPITLYAITDKGINHFPKHYAWMAELILDDLLETVSIKDGEVYMTKLGNKLASQLHQFEGKSLTERVIQLMVIMNELGFVVRQTVNEQEKSCLQACNCIYHDLAQKYPQICQFDLALMTSTLDESIELTRCMAKGDMLCEFLILNCE